MATIQGRGQIQDIELAADADGRITAVRVKLLADMGAYLQLVTPGIPLLGAFLYHGVYDVPAYSFECTRRVHQPHADRRLPGRRAARGDLRHRAGDRRAGPGGRRRPGRDPAAQLHPARPVPVHVGRRADLRLGQLRAHARPGARAGRLRRAPGRAAAPADAGETKHLGIGISTYVEMCGLAPSRVLAVAELRRRRLGGGDGAACCRPARCRSSPATTPHGQGHETCWSKIVADKLGVDPDDVEVLHSDTASARSAWTPTAPARWRSAGVAVAMAADKVVAKARTIAAHQLECAEDDLEFVDGEFRVKGTPVEVDGAPAVAFEAFTAHNLPDGMEPNLDGQVTYDPPNFTFPFGTHVAVVEVDEETGRASSCVATSRSTTAATRSTR